MGRKATPTLLKRLHGNPGKRALPVTSSEGRGQLWAPPDWLDEAQRKQWHYAIDSAPIGLLTETDREVLAIWCAAAVEHARAAAAVRSLGQVVKTKDGNTIQNPYMAIMNKQALIMLKAGSEMGFSPSARASLGSRSAAGGGLEPIEGGLGRSRSSELAAYLEEKPDSLN